MGLAKEVTQGSVAGFAGGVIVKFATELIRQEWRARRGSGDFEKRLAGMEAHWNTLKDQDDFDLSDVMAAIRDLLPEEKEKELDQLALEFEQTLKGQELGVKESAVEIMGDLLRVCEERDRALKGGKLEEFSRELLSARHELSQRLAVMKPDVRRCGGEFLKRFFTLLIPN